ncbi:hypothetical protein [Micromonospora sp. NPDC049274]|uniref:hypothetical protein n=1 Tax=Micromonospora sp. NPDC049274 TaxID=3154829 RepID=UPI003442ADB0
MVDEVVVAGVSTIAAAAVAAWATLRAQRRRAEVISLVDVLVSDAEVIQAEPNTDTHLVGTIEPDRPVLDVLVRNDGDRPGLLRRIHLDVQGTLRVPTIDPPLVVRFPGGTVTGGEQVMERRLGPSASYAVDFPLQKGRYSSPIRQEIPANATTASSYPLWRARRDEAVTSTRSPSPWTG